MLGAGKLDNQSSPTEPAVVANRAAGGEPAAPNTVPTAPNTGANEPFDRRCSVWSSGIHWPLESSACTGSLATSSVIVPSGFAQVDDVEVDNPDTNTRWPDNRVANCADTTSGRDVTSADAEPAWVTAAADDGTVTAASPLTATQTTVTAHNPRDRLRHVGYTRALVPLNIAPCGERLLRVS